MGTCHRSSGLANGAEKLAIVLEPLKRNKHRCSQCPKGGSGGSGSYPGWLFYDGASQGQRLWKYRNRMFLWGASSGRCGNGQWIQELKHSSVPVIILLDWRPEDMGFMHCTLVVLGALQTNKGIHRWVTERIRCRTDRTVSGDLPCSQSGKGGYQPAAQTRRCRQG